MSDARNPEGGRENGSVARGCGAVHESLIKLWMIDLADDHFEPDITRARV